MYICLGALQGVLVVKNLPANAGDARDVGSIPGLGRSPGVENGNPFQYSCLESSMDRGALWATVHGVTKSQNMTEQLNTHTHKHTHTRTQTQMHPIDSVSLENPNTHICEVYLNKAVVFKTGFKTSTIQGHYGEEMMR